MCSTVTIIYVPVVGIVVIVLRNILLQVFVTHATLPVTKVATNNLYLSGIPGARSKVCSPALLENDAGWIKHNP
jgi:hypothetical protein